MEGGEYGLTRGMCFVARRREVVAVAGLLRVSRCVFWVQRDFVVVFRIFFFERTRPAASMRPRCLIYLSTSLLRELYDADFLKPWIYGKGRVLANALDVFRCTPSRGGRSHRAAVDFVVCFGCDGISCFL